MARKLKRAIKRRTIIKRPRKAVMEPQLVAVNFAGSCKPYTYKAPAHWLIEVGDKIVVDSPSSGYTIVKVVNVVPAPLSCHDAHIALKWAVSTIDDSIYLANTKREREEREAFLRNERRRRLRVQIEALQNELKQNS